MLNQKGNLTIIIGVVILILIVGGGAYFLGKQTNKPTPLAVQPETTVQKTVTASPIDKPTPVVSESPQPDTTNWKTYTSTKANYSFKYPDTWPLVNTPPSPGCDTCVEQIDFASQYDPNSLDKDLGFILIGKQEDPSLEDFVKGDSSKVGLKDTTLGGEKAISYTLSGGIPPLPIIEYVVFKNGLNYTFSLTNSLETNKNKEENIKLFNEILSTLKFTN